MYCNKKKCNKSKYIILLTTLLAIIICKEKKEVKKTYTLKFNFIAPENFPECIGFSILKDEAPISSSFPVIFFKGSCAPVGKEFIPAENECKFSEEEKIRYNLKNLYFEYITSVEPQGEIYAKIFGYQITEKCPGEEIFSGETFKIKRDSAIGIATSKKYFSKLPITSLPRLYPVTQKISEGALICGGYLKIGNEFSPTSACEIFYENKITVERTSNMLFARVFASSISSKDGVIISGGIGEGGDILLTVEIFSFDKKTFSLFDKLQKPRFLHYSFKTIDGFGVIGGLGRDGFLVESVEIYKDKFIETTFDTKSKFPPCYAETEDKVFIFGSETYSLKKRENSISKEPFSFSNCDAIAVESGIIIRSKDKITLFNGSSTEVIYEGSEIKGAKIEKIGEDKVAIFGGGEIKVVEGKTYLQPSTYVILITTKEKKVEIKFLEGNKIGGWALNLLNTLIIGGGADEKIYAVRLD